MWRKKIVAGCGLAALLITSTSALANTAPKKPEETTPATPVVVKTSPELAPDHDGYDGPPIPKYCSLSHTPLNGGNFALPSILALAIGMVTLRRRRA